MVVDEKGKIVSCVEYVVEEYLEEVMRVNCGVRIGWVVEREGVDVVLVEMKFCWGMKSGNEGV